LLKIDSYTTLQINFASINNASQFIKNSFATTLIGLYKNYTSIQFIPAKLAEI